MRGKLSRAYWIIKWSGLFDKAYYLKLYDDVRKSDIDPIEHYVVHGWKEGRNPAPWFDTKYYLENNPDVASSGVNPFAHFIRWGIKEGRVPNSSWNRNIICKQNNFLQLINKFIKDLRYNGLFYTINKMVLFLKRQKEGYQIKNSFPFSYNTSKDLLIEYFNQLFENTKKLAERETFVPYQKHHDINTDIKLIAFYLPQFHPIPENDQFWEKGFTEWTNVTKTIPQFLGHYQPRLPIDLGFYDLRLVENIKRQVELAKNYGIYGFAFHHYWFAGKKILRTPIELFLKHKEIDFKFCVHFANENWTRRWDGLDHEILLKQEHSPEDDIAFIKDTARYFMDERYIRIKNKPLLIIYRPELFPNIKETVNRWREWCLRNGIGDIYLACMHSFVHLDPREIGFDAAIDYPPNTYPLTSYNHKFTIVNPKYQGKIYLYDDLIALSKKQKIFKYKKFRGICPSWDNEARRPGRGIVIHGSTPDKYQSWLENLIDYTRQNFTPEERFIFINAWNEWAEGTYLEPDRKHGYGYLEATYQALYFSEKRKNDKLYHKINEAKKLENKFSKIQTRHLKPIKILRIPNLELINPDSPSIKKKKAVFFHVHYVDDDILFDFVKRINYIPTPCHVYISTNSNYKKGKIEKIFAQECLHPFQIKIFPNRGRDIAPFLVGFREEILRYEIGCHIHTKKSLHNPKEFGYAWRNYLLQHLLCNEITVKNILTLFDNSLVGIVSPIEWSGIVDSYGWGSNFMLVCILIKLLTQDKIHINENTPLEFPAGSFFWFRTDAIKPLINLGLDFHHFPPEPSHTDGELQHAIERIFFYVSNLKGYGFIKYNIVDKPIYNIRIDDYVEFIPDFKC